ncbi:MAG: hypothetical protein GY812_16570 [Actinomycetia bacterium]|nr:hypothetical protein [Actinomycetes bacterium]
MVPTFPGLPPTRRPGDRGTVLHTLRHGEFDGWVAVSFCEGGARRYACDPKNLALAGDGGAS